MQGKRASRGSGHLQENNIEGPGPKYMTPEEAAQLLRISARTLSNWRSAGTGPTYKKIGGRVVYPRQAVVSFFLEIKGFGKNAKPEVKVTIRPYHRDNTRQQVDIMLHHPQTQQIVRRRLTAPAGMDPLASKAWGEQQVKGILRDLFRMPAEDQEEEPKNKTTTKQAIPTIPTIGDLWIRYQVEMPSAKQSQNLAQEKYWRKIKPMVQDIPCDAWTQGGCAART